MTPQELDALQGLCDGLTKAPWHGTILLQGNQFGVVGADDRHVCAVRSIKDARFIATARTALPALIAEVRRLQERCEAAEADLSIGATCDTCHNGPYKSNSCSAKRVETGGVGCYEWRGPQASKEDK